MWACVCSLRHPERNTHSPYCHLWPVWLYNIFPHYLTKGTIFEKKKLLNIKNCVFIFYTNFLEIVFILRGNGRHMIKYIYIYIYIFTFCWLCILIWESFFSTNLMNKFFISIHLLHSCTCFEHYSAHLQEDNCINTASGIVTVFGWLFSTQVTREL